MIQVGSICINIKLELNIKLEVLVDIASGNINQSLISDNHMKILFIIIIVPSAMILCNMVALPQMRALPDSFFHGMGPSPSYPLFFNIFSI